MRIQVLGPGRARVNETAADLALGPRKQRSVLVALAMTPGRPVSLDRLADLVWGGDPPRAASASLHAYVSGLRRVLSPGLPGRAAASVIATTDLGYRLLTDPAAIDAHDFATTIRSAARELAPLASQLERSSDPSWPSRAAVVAAVDRLESRLETWAGEPYADLPDHPFVLAERAALAELRLHAEEARLLGLLALGDVGSVLATTEAATARQPWREPLWVLHAAALARSGRQVEALDALRRLREALADDLGIAPQPRVSLLETAVLRHADALTTTPLPAPAPAARSSVSSVGIRSSSRHETVGRDVERHRLVEVLVRARREIFCCAQVVGEAGIGKTRMVEDLVNRAEEAGFLVGVGRCSQDDGAPPLWAWRAVLGAVSPDPVEVVRPPGADGGSPGRFAFEIWDGIVRQILDAARAQPLLVVLEDLHWADEATARTVAHLVSTAPADTPLAVVVTRRGHPAPNGALVWAVEALVRRDAVDVRLGGLDRAAAGALVTRLVRGRVSTSVVDGWHGRSGGNPFLLGELARLGPTSAAEVPVGVLEVVSRRLSGLPEEVIEPLVTAAVAGRRFRTDMVAATLGRDAGQVADELDRAREAELLVQDEPETFAFIHALTRDAVYLSLPPHRRARLHARIAHVLETDALLLETIPPGERTAELAHHWLAAGGSHASSAWRAARQAADQARASSAYAEAMQLRAAAVASNRRAGGHDDERYDLLLQLATDAAFAARWPQVEAAAVEAVVLARVLRSPERVAEAASRLTRYCVWLPHDPHTDVADTIEDLRWALDRVTENAADTGHADRTRCIAMLALAVELYYVMDAAAESRVLVETGLALARRSQDPTLMWWATRAAWMASWRPELTEDRARWSTEGLEAARLADDGPAEAVSLVTLGLDELELGRVDRWHSLARQATRLARSERLPYVTLTVDWIEMALAGLRGDPAAAHKRLRVLIDTMPDVAVPFQDVQVAVATMVAWLWDPGLPDALDGILQAHGETGRNFDVLHAMLARCGRVAELEQVLRSGPWPPVEELSSWRSVAGWCLEAEVANATGNRDLARRATRIIAPFTGRLAVAGAVMPVGPVDGYLALAAATLDDPAARRHADRAAELATAWGFNAYLTWFAAHRRRSGILSHDEL